MISNDEGQRTMGSVKMGTPLKSAQKEVAYREVNQAGRCKSIRTEMGTQGSETGARAYHEPETKPEQGWGEPGAWPTTKTPRSCVLGFENTPGDIF